MKPIDADVVTGLKTLQGDIVYDLNLLNKTKRQIQRERFVLAKFINEVVDSGQYDVSPLELDLHALNTFAEHHRDVILGMENWFLAGFGRGAGSRPG